MIAVIAVKYHNKKRTPKGNLPVQPVPAPAPSSVVYNLTCMYSIINSTTGKYCSLAFI